MTDEIETDEAIKSDLSPMKDATQTVLAPATVSSTPIMTVEETVVGSGSTNNVEEPEEVNNVGNAVVAAINEGLKLDEMNNKAKATAEAETDDADIVREDTIRGKEEEKTQEWTDGEKLSESSKAKGRKPRRKNNKRKVAQKAPEIVTRVGDEGNATVAANNGLTTDGEHNKEKATGEEETGEGGAVKEIIREDEKTEENKTAGEFGKSSNEKGREPRTRKKKKKAAQKVSEMVAVDGGKPELSSKKKASTMVESMGMVFMCSSKTKADCFRYKILGLPAGKKNQVAKIYKGMRLFLFDVDQRLMYGIFKAAGAGGYNIEPKAFKSAFPSQVRFTVMKDCLPLAEEKFKKVIKENYYTQNKFECQLNAQQVKKLCKLFAVIGKSGPSPINAIKNHRSGAEGSRRSRADSYSARDREKRKRRTREEERYPHPPLGREGRRYNDYEQAPVVYEQEALPSAVDPVPRYLPLPPQDLAPPVRSYGYERSYSYARDPVLEHRTFQVLDTKPRLRDEIVSRKQERDRDPYHLYRREPPYRDTMYPSVGQTVEYHHPPSAALPSEYFLVSREYNPSAAQPAEYHLSGGLQVSGYRDVGLTSEYRSSAASLPEYRPRQTRYRY